MIPLSTQPLFSLVNTFKYRGIGTVMTTLRMCFFQFFRSKVRVCYVLSWPAWREWRAERRVEWEGPAWGGPGPQSPAARGNTPSPGTRPALVHKHSHSDPYSFDRDPDTEILGWIRYLNRIQGFDQKLEKIYSWKKMFGSETTIYLYLGLHKGSSSYWRTCNFKIFSYYCGAFLPSWIRIQIHWPDWIRIQSKSGSNPDPKNCIHTNPDYMDIGVSSYTGKTPEL